MDNDVQTNTQPDQPQPKPHILVVDDDPAMRETLDTLLREYYAVTCVGKLAGARAELRSDTVDVVLLDILLNGKTGLDLLREMTQDYPYIPVVIITALDDPNMAWECRNLGARGFLKKPFDAEPLLQAIETALADRAGWTEGQALLQASRAAGEDDGIVGRTPAIRSLREEIRQAAATPLTVLITGESGAGKELVAYALHRHGPRADKRLFVFDCGHVNPNLIESELFGHEKGAFTGAFKRKTGIFEEAAGGTVFLDEIQNLPLDCQGKLLRVLATKQFSRVGSNTLLQADVIIYAASNRDLEKLVRDGMFREDLYHRLYQLHIHVPPLRDRTEDIPLLVSHFLELGHKEKGLPLKRMSKGAVDTLQTMRWPANVRQLRNALWRAIVSSKGPELDWEAIQKALGGDHEQPETATGDRIRQLFKDISGDDRTPKTIKLVQKAVNEETNREVVLEYLRWLFGRYEGTIQEVAARAGIGKSLLYNMIQDTGFKRESGGDG